MSSSASGSDDDPSPPSRHSALKSRSGKAYRPPSALGSPPQSSRTADSTLTTDDAREADRRRWREFRERRTPYRSAVLQLREKKPKATPVEPSKCHQLCRAYNGCTVVYTNFLPSLQSCCPVRRKRRLRTTATGEESESQGQLRYERKFAVFNMCVCVQNSNNQRV